MRYKLLEILCCIHCQSELLVSHVHEQKEDDIILGELACVTCQTLFPIIQGIPRMVANGDSNNELTKTGFEYQWFKRLGNKCESRSICYGYDIKKFVKWLSEVYINDQFSNTRDRWLLDAGCGSAEKTAQLAIKYPKQEVVAIDLTDTLAISKKENKEIKNLHFVQADILKPPFRQRSFDFIMSIGVLHHTHDTREAFNVITNLVQPNGGFLAWIYPLPSEDSFWAGLYRQRDKHFFKIGSKLPRRVAMFFCELYVAIFFPWILKFIKQHYRTNRDRFPIYPDKLSLGQLYQSLVFLSFDNIVPFYQFRHGKEEVISWYKENKFCEIKADYPGFFYGRF